MVRNTNVFSGLDTLISESFISYTQSPSMCHVRIIYLFMATNRSYIQTLMWHWLLTVGVNADLMLNEDGQITIGRVHRVYTPGGATHRHVVQGQITILQVTRSHWG